MAIKYVCDKCNKEIEPGEQCTLERIKTPAHVLLEAKHLHQACVDQFQDYVRDFFRCSS